MLHNNIVVSLSHSIIVTADFSMATLFMVPSSCKSRQWLD